MPVFLSRMSVVRFICWLLLAGCLLVSPASRAAADSLVWKKDGNQVSADIEHGTLADLLEKMAAATGWEIFVEPGTTRDVSVKFEKLPEHEAISRLLHTLNYALIPQTNGPAHFYVFRTAVGQATEAVAAKKKDKKARAAARKIPAQLIVTLDPNSRLTIEEIAALLGAKILKRADALHAYLLQFGSEEEAEAALKKLASMKDVASSENNYAYDPTPPEMAVPISSVRPFALSTNAISKDLLIVGLIDTGVQALEPSMEAFILDRISVAGEYELPTATMLHGTSMAQAFLQGMQLADNGTGRAGIVRLLSVNTYESNSNTVTQINAATTTYSITLGVYAAINKGAAIINISQGSPGDSPLLHRLISDAQKQGVVFYAAAGNEPTADETYPAAYPEVMAVTASDRDGNLAAYANYGPFVDVILPGTTLVKYNGQTYAVAGTSVSSAIAAGMTAGLSGKVSAVPAANAALLQNWGIQNRLGK